MTAENPSKSEIIFKLYARLKQSPCTIAILEDWKNKNGYTFSSRTLYRYMDELARTLSLKGETIEVFKGEFNKKTWKLIYNQSNGDFTSFDINTFYLSKAFIPKSMLTERVDFFSKLDDLFYKNNSKSGFEKSVDAFSLGIQSSGFFIADYSKTQLETIELAIWAIQNKRQIITGSLRFLIDHSINKIKTGDLLLPLSLLNHRGLLNLCAYNKSQESIVIIGFDVLHSILLTNENFNPRKYINMLKEFSHSHFGITQNMNNHTYCIELEFAESTGNYIRNFFWHSSQQFKILKNGNTGLLLQCGINRELVGWIFLWMNNVKVKKPLLLKRLVEEVHLTCNEINTTTASIKYENLFLKNRLTLVDKQV